MQLIQHCENNVEVKIQVSNWLSFVSINNQYIEYEKSIYTLYNYVKRVGLFAVISKVRSRISEKNRNKKIIGIGIGYISVHNSTLDTFEKELVVFLATNHSLLWKDVVIDKRLVFQFKENIHSINNINSEFKNFINKNPEYISWTKYSGEHINFKKYFDFLCDIFPNKIHQLNDNIKTDCTENSSISEIFISYSPNEKNTKRKPIAILFGLGNYAKTSILPNIKKHVDLQQIHEIDPDQLCFVKNKKISYCTSPYPINDTKFDVWFIAGYHHTHVKLAILALNQGGVPVIEKPLATNLNDFYLFKNHLLQIPNAKYFICFHKRYSKINDFIKKDIPSLNESPLDFHCIVYEIPLPQYHWYNWKNSGSRLISNGCHWIDYFLFLNNYSEVIEKRIWKTRGSDMIVYLKLSNNAVFSMVLTDNGSKRIGVRDYIELRQGDITIKIIDSEIYQSENKIKILTKRKVNPMDAYSSMYNEITKKIHLNVGDYDTLKMLESTRVTLELEEQYQNLKNIS
jgi:predicted dehydrogenase